MVVKHTMASGNWPTAPHRQRYEGDGETYWAGTRVYPRIGETVYAAYRRQLKQTPPAAKPVAKPIDPRLAEIRKLQATQASLERAVAAKEREAEMAAERKRLEAELAQLQAQYDAKMNPKPRKGIRFAQSGFRPFGPKSAA